MKTIGTIALATAAILAAAPAQAAGTITNGSYTVGIGNNGELFDSATYIGFQRDADGYDPVELGTPRDSWGVSTSAGDSWADGSTYGSAGVTTTFATFGGAATSALTATTAGVSVAQNYLFVAPNVLRIDHTITNTSGTALSSVLFQRNWDTDPPITFNNASYDFGTKPAAVIDSTYYGFETPVARQPYNNSCFSGCDAQGDLGGGIKLNLGDLGIGQSTRFSYFYGISGLGQSPSDLLAQATGLGAKYGIASVSLDFEQSQSAFIGVGMAGVPEPATWALMILGFGAVGGMMRRRRTTGVLAVA